ncbi:MAG: trypsin-like peptidase domain-containing protein [Gemmatimonadetes bacterium]|nr:trypsin-like peptidase domain-containing protein [Gemmatimonadota bacterium]
MSLALTVRTGALAGRTLTFGQAMISVGRAPDCDLRFDAQQDIDVSGRHAEIVVIGSRVVLRDVGSTNGTFVNGTRLEDAAELYDGDVVSFGEHGPQAVIGGTGRARPDAPAPATRVSSGIKAPGASGAAAAGGSATPSRGEQAGAPAPRSTQMRIEAAVEKSTAKLQRTMVAVVGVLGLAVIGAYAYGRTQADKVVALMQAQLDAQTAAMTQAMAAQKGKQGGLDTILARLGAENQQLRDRLDKGGSSEEVEKLKKDLEDQQRRGRLVMDAAKVDFSSINEKSGKAVALLIVEMPDGSRSAATGFCVNEKGIIVTNRHAVRDGAMNSPTRIAVLFNETTNWLPAHLLRTNEGEDDLAVLQIDRPGPFPVVAGVAAAGEDVKVGGPVALIGFPLGTDAAQEGTGLKIRASASLVPGTVSKILDRLTQIDAYATHGSSGSPVFDARGYVVGVVYGGPTEAQGRIVYAVPASRLNAELAR